MRGYVAIGFGELQRLAGSSPLQISTMYLPTTALASDYGVSDLEEIEYAALELARDAAEYEGKALIVAVEIELDESSLEQEVEVGVIRSELTLSLDDVVALYRVTAADEELEWYDVTELSLLINRLGEK